MITIRNFERKDLLNVIENYPCYSVVYSNTNKVLSLYDHKHNNNIVFNNYEEFLNRKE